MKLNDKKEMNAIGSFLIIKPLEFNPYINKISDSGIILTGDHFVESQETGERIKEEQRIQYAIVMETGSDCKTFNVGDELIFDIYNARPLPVLDLGLFTIPEGAAMCRISGDGDPFQDAIDAEKAYEERIKTEAKRRKQEDEKRKVRDSLILPSHNIIT